MATFAEQVYDIVRAIPAGSVCSYQEVALAAGRPRAARAVANLMARNYDPSIPCHRVIRSDGTLGGYNRGGTPEKARLLQREGAVLYT
jgi:O-6-methylguanine DNA methyltransferase